MRKLAIFVEGNTELVFVERLVIEVCGFHQINIQKQVLHGGAIQKLYDNGVNPELANFHVLIVNCESDGKVKPAIIERVEALRSNGYERILGLRDVYPINRADLERLREGLLSGLTSLSLPTHIVLAVMEVEAWFIGEWSHFQRLDARLTPAYILDNCHIDVQNSSAELIDHPASALHTIYQSAGFEYRKKDSHAHAVAARVDYEVLYAETRESHPSLHEFVDQLDSFFSPAGLVGSAVS